MKTKIRTIKCKPYTKEDFEHDYRSRKRTQVIGVDFQKIEDAPRTDLEIEIQQKIASAPSASDLLIKEEEQAMLKKALSSVRLSRLDRACFELTLEGLKPMGISRRLNITRDAAKIHLGRATNKIRTYIRRRWC